MSAGELREALEARGIACSVEARGRLAVIVAPANGVGWAESSRVAMVVALAEDAGFTHVALEIPDTPARAALPGA